MLCLRASWQQCGSAPVAGLGVAADKEDVTWSLRLSPGLFALLLIASFGLGCNFEGTPYAEQYREQGNRICARFAQEVALIPAPSSSRDFRRYLRRRALVAERLTDFGRRPAPRRSSTWPTPS